MKQDCMTRNVFEWHPVEHMPLLALGKLAAAKKATGHVPLKDCVFITPTYILINYQYRPLENQFLFGLSEIHLKILKLSFDYIDRNRTQVDILKRENALLTQKIQVKNIYIT